LAKESDFKSQLMMLNFKLESMKFLGDSFGNGYGFSAAAYQFSKRFLNEAHGMVIYS
jgi:hypothetical protein